MQRLLGSKGVPRHERRKRAREVDPTALIKDVTEGLQKEVDRLGILSLSATHENILMWSHYALGHQGICLQFRVTVEPPFFAPALPVTYSEELPVPDFLDPDKQKHIEALLLTKAANWRYEREWRMIDTSGAGAREFPPALLSGVLLGARMSAADKVAVRKWVKESASTVAIYQAEVDIKRYALQFVQVA